jgi:hypothetical protein
VSVIRIIRGVFDSLFGAGGLYFCFAYKMEPLYFLLCFGLMAWGAWEVVAELRDRSDSGEVGQLREARQAMAKRMEGESGD